MRTVPLLRRIAGPALLAFVVAGPAAGDIAAWDQARATAIAQQLAGACDAFQQTVEKQPGIGEVGDGSAAMGFSLQRSARALREQSMALGDHLAKGKDQKQTRDEWRSMKEISDDVEQSAQRSELDDPTMASWAKVADLMRQLAPYYDAKAMAP